MPAAPPRAKQPTWRDWMPEGTPEPTEDQLLTRDQLVRRLRAMNVPTTPRMVLHWETQGALPRPVRRWYRGATRATYAPWVVDAAAQVPALRRTGVPFPEIGRRLRAALAGSASASLSAASSLVASAVVHKASNDEASVAADGRSSVAAPPTDAELAGALATFAQRYFALGGIPVSAVEVRVTGADGVQRLHHFPPRGA